MKKIVALVSWAIVGWMCFVFLSSLPYKFTRADETQHIFGTIGTWLSGFLCDGIGQLFTNFGGFAVGGFELLTSIVLLLPALLWLLNKGSDKPFGNTRRRWHQFGGLLAAAVMAGAVFFHLFTPLGINVNGDGGFLFGMAVSVLVLGIILFIINRGGVDVHEHAHAGHGHAQREHVQRANRDG